MITTRNFSTQIPPGFPSHVVIGIVGRRGRINGDPQRRLRHFSAATKARRNLRLQIQRQNHSRSETGTRKYQVREIPGLLVNDPARNSMGGKTVIL